MMRFRGGIFLLGLLASAAPLRASTVYRITGEVVGVTSRTVSIRSGADIFEFSRSPHLGMPKEGDRITILYHLDAQQITPAPESGGEAPEVPGISHGPTPSGIPSGSGHPGILDDRAFYNAKNQPRPTRKNPS